MTFPVVMLWVTKYGNVTNLDISAIKKQSAIWQPTFPAIHFCRLSVEFRENETFAQLPVLVKLSSSLSTQ